MSSEAVTLNASRTFGGNVVVTWTPSTTKTALTVLITVGGAFAWQYVFDPDNTTATPEGEGDNWSLDSGTFSVEFSGDGKTGSLKADKWVYTVGKNSHHAGGTIGVW